ncbi:MAG: DUF736 domain-containing protein [Caulobacterales bacterium]
MAIVGRFCEREDGALIGHIRTMFFKSDKVVFEPSELTGAKAPTFRVFTGDEIELGAAWRRASKETGSVYYDVKLDDPTFAQPIWCRLAQAKNGAGYMLVWERTTTKTKAA